MVYVVGRCVFYKPDSLLESSSISSNSSNNSDSYISKFFTYSDLILELKSNLRSAKERINFSYCEDKKLLKTKVIELEILISHFTKLLEDFLKKYDGGKL